MDKPDEFDKVFGKYPVSLPPNPTSVDVSTTVKLLLNFSELCRLDVYLYAYRKFMSVVLILKKISNAQEVCREISDLRQEWKDKHGKIIVDYPEELFTNFLSLAGSLLDCAE